MHTYTYTLIVYFLLPNMEVIKKNAYKNKFLTIGK